MRWIPTWLRCRVLLAGVRLRHLMLSLHGLLRCHLERRQHVSALMSRVG